MQNRYVGDVGDFGKYATLRMLTGMHPERSLRLRLGVIWYLVPDETGPVGRHSKYLLPGHRWAVALMDCDPALYWRLKALIDRDERNVEAVSRAGILPDDTVFFERIVPSGRRTEPNRHRRAWFVSALGTVDACDLVFFDPDNGLVGNHSAELHRPQKYAFLEEVERIVARRQSVLVYHHLGRSQPGRHQIRSLLKRLRRLPEARRPFALWYHRGTARVFLVVPSQTHERTLRGRAAGLSRAPWRYHFTRVD